MNKTQTFPPRKSNKQKNTQQNKPQTNKKAQASVNLLGDVPSVSLFGDNKYGSKIK